MQTFKQTRKVGESGSFQNQMMGNNATRPEAGNVATILSYTDRNAYDVISVSECGTKCVIREMKAKCLDYYAGQYEVSSDEDGAIHSLEWNEKKGKWGFVSESIELTGVVEKQMGWNFKENFETRYRLGVIMASRVTDGLIEYPVVQKGLTRVKKHFSPVSIIFGKAEFYYDPSF